MPTLAPLIGSVKLVESRTAPIKLDALTGLRFFAALHVVLYHFVHPQNVWLASIIGHGYVSVPLFFILSGFVLTYNYFPSPRKINPRRFLTLRFCRIFPLYFVAFLWSAPTAIQAIRDGYPQSAVASHAVLFGVSALTLTHAWQPTLAMSWNPPSWSVSAEMFFYLVFPVAGYWISRLSRAGSFAVLIALSISGIAVSLGTYALGISNAYLQYNPLANLSYFLMGIATAKIVFSGRHNFGRAGLSLIAILGVLSALRFLPPSFAGPVCAPLFVWLIAALAMNKGRSGEFLSLAPIVILGDASYAMYLLQIPVQDTVRAVFGFTRPDLSFPEFMLYMSILIGLSLASFFWLETPVRRWMTAKLLPRTSVASVVVSRAY